jgi:hypothetical protein
MSYRNQQGTFLSIKQLDQLKSIEYYRKFDTDENQSMQNETLETKAHGSVPSDSQTDKTTRKIYNESNILFLSQ